MNINAPHILVVDDDNRIRDLLSKYLTTNNFLVSAAKDSQEAKLLIKEFQFDMFVLDIMMPGMTGQELAIYIRKFLSTPILMLTAMGNTEDKIRGLENGADDYLAKPFEPRELLLRIKNILARTKLNNESNLIQIGDLEFDRKTLRLSRENDYIVLTSTEAKLLSILVNNLNKPVSREDLASLCGGINERSIDVQIIRLRNKIESDPKKPRYIQAVRGAGYVVYS